MLPESRGKTYILRVLSIYNDLFRHKYGFHPSVTISKWGMQLKRLMKTHTELQIAAMMIVFFNWRGMDGGSDFEENQLTKIAHPPGWFFTGVNKWEAYLRNVFGLDFDNEDEVRNFVAQSMNAIK